MEAWRPRPLGASAPSTSTAATPSRASSSVPDGDLAALCSCGVTSSMSPRAVFAACPDCRAAPRVLRCGGTGAGGRPCGPRVAAAPRRARVSETPTMRNGANFGRRNGAPPQRGVVRAPRPRRLPAPLLAEVDGRHRRDVPRPAGDRHLQQLERARQLQRPPARAGRVGQARRAAGGRLPARVPGHVARRVADEADDDALPQPDGDGRRGVHPRRIRSTASCCSPAATRRTRRASWARPARTSRRSSSPAGRC